MTNVEVKTPQQLALEKSGTDWRDNTLTDRERIECLRAYAMGIGHTDGTPFEDATVSIHDIRPQANNIIGMKEFKPMMDYYAKLPTLVEMGHVISLPEQFVYWMFKDLGLIDAFLALAEYEAKVAGA
jgi:hypothetical protein